MNDKHGFVVCSECRKGFGTLKKDTNGGYVHISCHQAKVQRVGLILAVRKNRAIA